MHLDPHVAFAAVSTLGAGWLMMKAGLQKSALERRRQQARLPVLRPRDPGSRLHDLHAG